MRWVVGLVGIALLAIVLWDAFETIILPRRVAGRFRLTKFFYRTTWRPWRSIAPLLPRRTGDAFLSFYGPLSLLLLLALWASGIVFAFGMLQWAAGSALTMAGAGRGRAAVALPVGQERGRARRAVTGVGALVRRCAREPPLLSGTRVLPLAALQPVVARCPDDDSRRQRSRHGWAGGVVRGAGEADVRHGAPRRGGSRAGL